MSKCGLDECDLHSGCVYECQYLRPHYDLCFYCHGKREIETDNNGPVVPCPMCKGEA